MGIHTNYSVSGGIRIRIDIWRPIPVYSWDGWVESGGTGSSAGCSLLRQLCVRGGLLLLVGPNHRESGQKREAERRGSGFVVCGRTVLNERGGTRRELTGMIRNKKIERTKGGQALGFGFVETTLITPQTPSPDPILLSEVAR